MAQIARRLVTLAFDDVGYEGLTCEAWVSAPLSKTDQLVTTKDETKMRELLLELIPAWNFEDEDGPIPHTAEGFDRLPRELLVGILAKYQLRMNRPSMPGFSQAS